MVQCAYALPVKPRPLHSLVEFLETISELLMTRLPQVAASDAYKTDVAG